MASVPSPDGSGHWLRPDPTDRGYRPEVVVTDEEGTALSLGGGGAATVADGADVTQGAKADAAASTDTGTFSQVALFKRLLQGITTLVAGIVPAAGEAHVGQVGASSRPVRVEKTRPADANAYAANDVIAESASAGTVWTFAVGRITTGEGVLIGACVATDNTAAVHRLELDLYDDTVTAINDNAEATRLYANQGKYLGTISFPALAKRTANSTAAEATAAAFQLPFRCVGSSSIYGILRTLDALTPVSGSKITVTLFELRD